jgi:phosphotransacetylase
VRTLLYEPANVMLDPLQGPARAQGLGFRHRQAIAYPVAARANILLVPDLEAGNMLANSLSFLAMADVAGIVLGAPRRSPDEPCPIH